MSPSDNEKKTSLGSLGPLLGYLLPIMLVVVYLAEAFSKIQELETLQYSELPRYIKALVVLPFCYLLIRNSARKMLLWILVPCIIFVLGQLTLSCGFGNNAILNAGRYLFPIVVLGAFAGNVRKHMDLGLLFRTFEWLMVFNTALILVGFIFGVEIFETYNLRRFGYNGLIMTSSASTYIYTISIFYFLIKFRERAYRNWMFIAMLIGSFLVGTKSLYLVLAVVFGYMIWMHLKGGARYVFLSAFILIAAAGGYYVFYSYDIFRDMIQESGLWSAILSGRDELFLRDTLPFIQENWKFTNYLFGGVCDFSTRSEMGFVDMFYFWGILGSLWYLWVYYRSFMTFQFTLTIAVFTGLLLIIVSMAGNFFIYTSLPLFLLIFRERVMHEQVDLP